MALSGSLPQINLGVQAETQGGHHKNYDDFIEMFTVPTPISPLTPTPVAFPSHEPSQDVIYDSLPPMEQSKVPE
ncbi:hypothetical protein TNCV_1971071 [Trichonephila clavipes]|uniref:Uncharacterized protein n=1 Tax=Trichonephila clavipes TaxID=2585209 RepID=A0A8X6W5R0_TRICX|nr:hypothetical protein TNCV_1971071 [Trichonephila clavipes]